MSVRSSSYQPSSTTSSAALAADSQEYRLGSPPQIDDSPAQLSSAPRPNTSSDISFGDEDAEENFSDRRSRGCCVNACPEVCLSLSVFDPCSFVVLHYSLKEKKVKNSLRLLLPF